MQEQLKNFWNKAKKAWQNTSKAVKKWLVIGLIGALVVAAVILVINLLAPYETLFTGLSQTDMTNVVTYLNDNGVTDYRIDGNDTVLVRSNEVAQLKADLLMQGYPASGFGYSTYLDNVSALTTESERNTLKLYGLQDEMEAVIRCFDFVEDAQVIINPGEDNTYVLDSSNVIEASASVMVTMSGGQSLSQAQVEAISNLVSRAVQGLHIDNISITDTSGNSYSTSENGITGTQDAATLKLELEREVNNTLRSNILFVLEPLFGADNIRISVNSTVDVERSVTESVNYTLEDWAQDGSTGGENIIGSRVYDQEILRAPDETEGGAAGTTTNADINTYVEEAATDENLEHLINYGEDDYLVDTQSTQSESLGGTVSDVMVSITLNSNATGGMNEIELYDLVARAAGIDAEVQQDKIDIMIAPFYDDGTSAISAVTQLPDYIIYILIGLGAFVILLIILMIILSAKRRKKRKKQEAEEKALEAQRVAEAQALGISPAAVAAGISSSEITDQIVDIMDIRSDRSVELRKTVRNFAQQNPEIAAQMVKNWLKEGEESNG